MNERLDQSTPPGQPLAPPRAAAIAGLIFSLSMLISLGIIPVAIPEVLEAQSTVNARFGRAITLSLHQHTKHQSAVVAKRQWPLEKTTVVLSL